eukprot:3520716-Amphidinium_carterae.1
MYNNATFRGCVGSSTTKDRATERDPCDHHNPDNMEKEETIGVTAKYLYYIYVTIYSTFNFRMVAERGLHHIIRRVLRGFLRELVQGFKHLSERGQQTCSAVYSARLVEPTLLDPTRGRLHQQL